MVTRGVFPSSPYTVPMQEVLSEGGFLPSPCQHSAAGGRAKLGISSESYCFCLATVLRSTWCAGMTKVVNQLRKRTKSETRIIPLAEPQVLMEFGLPEAELRFVLVRRKYW